MEQQPLEMIEKLMEEKAKELPECQVEYCRLALIRDSLILGSAMNDTKLYMAESIGRIEGCMLENNKKMLEDLGHLFRKVDEICKSVDGLKKDFNALNQKLGFRN